MTHCTTQLELLPRIKSRKIKVDFNGGDITSDAGVMLLRQVDNKLGLTRKASKVLTDSRQKARCRHSFIDLLRQRVYGIALGYEDLNDHDSLRHDLAFQSALSRDTVLGSSPTLCRFEARANRERAVGLSTVLVETFIQSQPHPPKELILDFDATDDRVHGNQEGRFFHGYYDHYCFLPLYVFCNEQLLVSYLRPSNIDPAKHSLAILSLLVKRFRQVWPHVRIIIRADSGFCRWRLLKWCDHHAVNYIIGVAKNNRLNTLAEPLVKEAYNRYTETGNKQRLFTSVHYAAKTWDHERRVIVKAEYDTKGSNPRYVVTNLQGEDDSLYDDIYCMRSDMENRIKEQQLALFADRTSAHRWWQNQFRVLLSSLAYVLIESLRRLALNGTKLARAQCHTIRLKLFKIGAVITRNTRTIFLHLSSAYPYKTLFFHVAGVFSPG